MRARLLLALVLATPPAAHAARPMITDDARTVDAKACQVEAWTRVNPDSHEYWALPACNPTGNLEITFGGARTSADGRDAFTDQVIQGKTILRPLEPDGWGVGFAAGVARHLHRESANGWPGDFYFYVPASIAFGGDEWVVHLNAGAVHRRDLDQTVGTWGIGNEIRLMPTLYFIPEVFRSEPGRPFFQAGFRYWLVKDRVQIDATYGSRFGSDTREHWYSIGMRLLSPPFIP